VHHSAQLTDLLPLERQLWNLWSQNENRLKLLSKSCFVPSYRTSWPCSSGNLCSWRV